MIATSGCVVDGFRGANFELDMFKGTPGQARIGVPPMLPAELPANTHFTVYGVQETVVDGVVTESRLFELTQFEIHRIVDATSPCFIDVGEHVPHPGLHVTRYAAKIAEDTGITDPANPPATATDQQRTLMETAVQRMLNVALLGSDAGIQVVSSASPASYPAVAAACGGSPDQIPPANCIDDASNALRLELCQAAWKANPDLFEGTDRVLTAPLNGTTHGTLVGSNPINMAPVGGAQFFVPNTLDDINAYAIYIQGDGSDALGTQAFFGRPTMTTRGVGHVHLTSPLSPLLFAEMAVFVDLGEDDVTF